MAEGSEDRTEPATPHRRREARKKGQVCMSPEVPAVAALLGTFIALSMLGGRLLEGLLGLYRHYFQNLPAGEVTAAQALHVVQEGMAHGALLFLPLLGTAFLLSLLMTVSQVGLHYMPETLSLRFDKFNPGAGLGRLISVNSWVTLLNSLLKLAAITIVCWLSVRDQIASFVHLPFGTPLNLVTVTGSAVLALGLRVALLMAVIAFLDWCWHKWQYEKSLRMTKQEVKDEHKLLEGDPRTRARIRRIQYEMARKRMMSAVKTADVVVRNPTHYAVALKYDRKAMDAPQLVAKGMNFMARKILEAAARFQIPIVADAPLARTLYRSVAVGRRIPVNLYRAVARILAQIYRSRRMRAGAAA